MSSGASGPSTLRVDSISIQLIVLPSFILVQNVFIAEPISIHFVIYVCILGILRLLRSPIQVVVVPVNSAVTLPVPDDNFDRNSIGEKCDLSSGVIHYYSVNDGKNEEEEEEPHTQQYKFV